MVQGTAIATFGEFMSMRQIMRSSVETISLFGIRTHPMEFSFVTQLMIQLQTTASDVKVIIWYWD